MIYVTREQDAYTIIIIIIIVVGIYDIIVLNNRQIR